jgi:hypothetical protein
MADERVEKLAKVNEAGHTEVANLLKEGITRRFRRCENNPNKSLIVCDFPSMDTYI